MKNDSMVSAEIKIHLGNEAVEYAKLVDRMTYKRSSIEINNSNGNISISIKAKDVVALFATINSVMKQFSIISSTRKLLGKNTNTL